MCKCIGCGVNLQNIDESIIGYTDTLDNMLCKRCFRIRNYNEYKLVVKDNLDYINILNNINKTNDLVILVVDLFNINKSLEDIKKYINNDILLVLTKRDILPRSCYDKKLMDYFDNYKLNIVDKIIISSKKNYNFDELYNKINKYKKGLDVYVVGFTNSGKSSMINKIIYNYTNNKSMITTSNLPSTTIDSIKIKINDSLNIIDTPGLLDEGDIINYVDSNTLKRIIPSKEIKPITYQIKGKQKILIDDLVSLQLEDTNITIYMSNKLDIKRVYNKDCDFKEELHIEDNSDLVISGLGFIKFKNKCDIKFYAIDGVEVYTRKSLI